MILTSLPPRATQKQSEEQGCFFFSIKLSPTLKEIIAILPPQNAFKDIITYFAPKVKRVGVFYLKSMRVRNIDKIKRV